MSMNVNYGSFTAAKSARLMKNGDTNKDGTLDQNEIASMKAERNAEGKDTPWLNYLQKSGQNFDQVSLQSHLEGAYQQANPADMMVQGDLNKDGVLTKDELISLKETRHQEGSENTPFVDNLIYNYEKIDATGQGLTGEQINQFYLGEESSNPFKPVIPDMLPDPLAKQNELLQPATIPQFELPENSPIFTEENKSQETNQAAVEKFNQMFDRLDVAAVDSRNDGLIEEKDIEKALADETGAFTDEEKQALRYMMEVQQNDSGVTLWESMNGERNIVGHDTVEKTLAGDLNPDAIEDNGLAEDGLAA